ncbi:Dabb family protein [Hasllibacter sp. MH4015]|uniref:Dabb family protein n=1 Tax=Hasllibacter sp. MH4015 TaxID=2854029 RepID=UPI001CD32889|nr:Dabb family protein [Hasllibacter sp. MH4015]
MLLHIVLLDPADDAGLTRIKSTMADLAAVAEKLPGLTRFDHGPNRDFEGKSQRYPYGFCCTFTDRAALEAYAADPDHQAAGAQLVASCKGGANGIFVADLEV